MTSNKERLFEVIKKIDNTFITESKLKSNPVKIKQNIVKQKTERKFKGIQTKQNTIKPKSNPHPINESENNDGFSFNTTLDNSSFYNYDTFTKEYDSEISESQITISWKIKFWANESGIENFLIEATDVQGQFIMTLYDKQTGEEKQKSPKNIEDFQWKFRVGDGTLMTNGSLYVNSLEFDFKTGICDVNF